MRRRCEDGSDGSDGSDRMDGWMDGWMEGGGTVRHKPVNTWRLAWVLCAPRGATRRHNAPQCATMRHKETCS
eukprot:53576-Chlamydomonas_euryale.AAC.1